MTSTPAEGKDTTANPDTATRWLSYDEIAVLRGIDRESAVRWARRKRWPRRDANDGTVRLAVPADILQDTGRRERKPQAVREDIPADIPPDIPPDIPGDNPGTIRALEDHVRTLREELATARRSAAEVPALAERVGKAEGEAVALREALLREVEQRERVEGERETLATEIIRQRERTAQAEGEAVAMREALAREARRLEDIEAARQLDEIARQRAETLANGEQQRLEQARVGQKAAAAELAALRADVTAKKEALAREARQVEEAEAERQRAETQRDAAQAARDATAAELANWTAGGPLARAWRGFWRGR